LAFAVQLYRSGRTQQKAKVVGSKFDRTRSPARRKQTKTKSKCAPAISS